MEREMKVWLVGSKKNDSCPEVYAEESLAIRDVMKYIFEDEDEHWMNKLDPEAQEIVKALVLEPALAIKAYNRFAPEDAKWTIHEAEVIEE